MDNRPNGNSEWVGWCKALNPNDLVKKSKELACQDSPDANWKVKDISRI